MVIMISGKAGVGKSTCAKFIKEYLESRNIYCDIIPLATRVKEIAELDFNWDGLKDERGRQLLINIGTVTGRRYDPNIWVKETLFKIHLADINPSDTFVIDDWRFPNELQYIKDHYNGKVISIRIERPEGEILKNTPNYSDESETSLPSLEFIATNWNGVLWNESGYNFVLCNEGNTLEETNSTISSLMGVINDGFRRAC